MLRFQVFDRYFDVEAGIGEASGEVVFYGTLKSFVVVLEEKDSVVLRRKILEVVPQAGLEALQALELTILISQDLLSSILNFIFELQLVFSPHLHLDSFGLLISFIAFLLI